MTTALSVIAGLIGLTLLLLTVQLLTGRTPRAYAVLPEDGKVQVNGQEFTPAQLAETYRPVMHGAEGNATPPLLAVNYEVVDAGDRYVVNYFHEWEDEIHPSPYVHAAYRVYRGARYGIPVRDIEYLQVDVDAATGDVAKVRFETTPGTDYLVGESLHLIVQYARQADGSYAGELTDTQGTPVTDHAPAPLRVVDGHAQVVVATWNHLTSPALANETYPTTYDAPLHYLTEQEYRDGKYARKSQGDVRTDETPLAAAVGVVSTVVYFLVSGIGLIYLVRRIRERHDD